MITQQQKEQLKKSFVRSYEWSYICEKDEKGLVIEMQDPESMLFNAKDRNEAKELFEIWAKDNTENWNYQLHVKAYWYNGTEKDLIGIVDNIMYGWYILDDMADEEKQRILGD